MNKKLSVLMAVFLSIVVVFTGTFTIQARAGGPGLVCGLGLCTNTGGDGTADGSGGARAGSAAPDGMTPYGMSRSTYYYIHGGYVAAGVSLRNHGAGPITLSGIPVGAKVIKAYLYWNIIDAAQNPLFAKLRLNNKKVTGTFIGSDHTPCWSPDYNSSYSYRADVTKKVKGNGVYTVSFVPSGTTDGSDPFTTPRVFPLAEGASLVAIYTRSDWPLNEIFIWDGATYGSLLNTSQYILVGPYLAAANPVGQVWTTTIAADGQTTAGPTISVNGIGLSLSDLDGGDPKLGGGSFSQGNLWDTKTFYVSAAVTPGSTASNITINNASSGDCVTWVAQVFSIGP